MKFAHMGDCHLGAWATSELKDLNLRSFQYAIDCCIKEKLNFVLITGDLFDSAYPQIETLKDTFKEFRKLKEAEIPVFLIAGSHDYSASGKSFLDVLEKAGFCKNVSLFEIRGDKIILLPTIYENVALYGYPGKKSGMEVDEIARIKMQDSPGLFKILLLHTTLKDAVNNTQIKAVDENKLPKVDYLALSHLHIEYCKENRVYSGPIFPNNISELEELQKGSFYIFDNGRIRREEIRIKDILSLSIKINNTYTATKEILNILEKQNLRDKIIILRVTGILEQGKLSDIDFSSIESYALKNGAYSFLKNANKLLILEPEFKLDIQSSEDLEIKIIKKFEETNPSNFNYLIPQIFKVLQLEKQEEEKSSFFEDRLLAEVNKVIQI